MKLFDEFERNYDGPSEYAEPKFTYYNRSARPDIVRIRVALEKWFIDYPDSEKKEFRERFRSTNDSHHSSAFFELVIYELLLHMGCLVEIHCVPSSVATRRPDFLVAPPDGNKFYMEAVLATDESNQKSAARARINAVYDAINRFDSPNFFIGMELKGEPKAQPSARNIKQFLTKKLQGLDADQITRQQIENPASIPRWRYEHDGWQIDFSPIPKSENLRGKPGVRPIGQWSTGMQEINVDVAIRDAITKKAGRYGELDLPYIIAVNVLSEWGADQITIMNALFGQDAMQFNCVGDKWVSKPIRKPNGAWIHKSGPTNTRVSAALIFTGLYPHNIPGAIVHLYHNPWAAKPYSSILTCLPQGIIMGKNIELREGQSLGAVLKMPANWPN